MKIWQLDPANLTPYYNLALCKALAEAGQTVHYVTSAYLYDRNLPVPKAFTRDYAYFRGLDKDWLLRFSGLRKVLRGISYPFDHWRVMKQIRQQRPDIVHMQWSRLPRFDHPFISSIRASGIPVVHTVHNVRSSFATPGLINALGKVYADADALILHSAANQSEFLALYPHIDADRTHIVPLITTPYPFPVPDASPASLKAAFGFAADDFVVLFFGIIRQYKGLSLLLDALPAVWKMHPNLRVLIGGKPETEQDRLEVERAREMERIIVHDRFIPSEDLWRYFRVADLAVFPYRTITQSAALIQAMDFGLPVIATDVGAFRETIDGNGWIVPEDDPAALADALQQAAQDRTLSAKADRSRELIQDRHTGPAVAQRLLAVYGQL